MRPSTILLAGLALSIGWGIRGNFGHEFGAMIPGCLTAIVVCLLSGREDWRRRVVYFAFFGALGWGFGGSISYMQVVAYTHSGHLPSQVYGFAALFYIGFLWAALGGAGTAFPAVVDRERLGQVFKPLVFVFASWFLLDLVHGPLEAFLEAKTREAVGGVDGTWHRHKSPLYWFDADWLPALFALIGVGAFDLWDRRERNTAFLPAFAAAGALLGWLVQWMLRALGWAQPLAALLTRPLGDPGSVVVDSGEVPAATDFLTNWPQFCGDFPQHVGWITGLSIGVGVYFWWFGKWRCGASLFLCMAVGWFVAFLAGPVLGGLLLRDHGGFSMTPPRADDWAGITGVFVGATIWFLRNGLAAVSLASVVSGFLGGLAFSGAQLLKLLLTWPGNGYRLVTEAQRALNDASVVELETLKGQVSSAASAWTSQSPFWSHWQGQNWHSVLEQTYGFLNGVAIAVAIGLLVRRTGPLDDEPRPWRWTAGVAAVFVLFALPYVNLVKNVSTWVGRKAVPPSLQMPLVPFEWANWSARTWFSIVFALAALGFLVLWWRHGRRPLAIVPASAVGKGQALFLVILWIVVVGNFERALVAFGAQRLITEGVIFLNAILVTVLLLTLARDSETPPTWKEPGGSRPLVVAWLFGLVGLVATVSVETALTRWAYGDHWSGHSGYHMRFGEKADWRVRPNLTSGKHR